MFRNNLLTALRTLLRHKLYAAINVFGLAVGLAACLLIALFVRHELSFDSFFPEADRIYRLSPDFAAGTLGPERYPAANVAPLGPLLAEAQLPGVAAVGRVGGMSVLISTDDLVSYEDNFRWADPSLFEVFRFQWLRGAPEQALARPDAVVISESIARKYFGEADPMGEVLTLENSWPLTVSGVIADIPANSHLSADLIVPMATAWRLLDFDYGNNWSYTNFHTYLRLQPGAEIGAVVAQGEALITSRVDETLARFFGIGPDTFALTPYSVRDIHLTSGRPGEFKTPGSLTFVLAFTAIAFCLLLIACINFMNLSTARAARRAKEVGMRKAIGASQAQLVRQFLGESLVITTLALLVALGLAELLLPAFSAVVNRDLDFAVVREPGFAFFIAAVALCTALIAGSYPAFYLSGFQPVRVLKFDGRLGLARGLTVRNMLVVFQFTLAIVLIVCTLVVGLQMRHARDFDLGFNKDQIVVLSGSRSEGMGAQWGVLKRELLQHPDILAVTEGEMGPGRAGTRPVRIEGGAPEGLDMLTKNVGFNFFDTYEMTLVAGRDFNEALATDLFYPPPNVAEGEQPTGSYILNETAVRQLGLAPEEVLGKTFEVDFSADFSLAVTGPVIGVVEDVHPFSLREPMQAMVYIVPPERWGNQPSFAIASVRISGRDVEQSLTWIKEKWAQFNSDVALYHYFLDSDYVALYQNEERQAALFTFFAVLSIIIASLGLFGLATFTVEQRFKEIGVRKVMGGSAWSIVLLLTNDFSRLVLLSNLIAWPVAYLAMSGWLEQFAYRIDLTPMIFIGSGLTALCIAWVTVGGTAAKAANQKPVLALRYE